MNADLAYELVARHSDLDRIRAMVADAPPPPGEGIEMLRATGYPTREKAS